MRRFVVLLPIAALLALLWMAKPDPSREDGVVIGVSLLNLSNEFIVDIKEAMEAKAAAMGANAIIGIDLDYETISMSGGGNMLRVSANGTAVSVK